MQECIILVVRNSLLSKLQDQVNHSNLSVISQKDCDSLPASTETMLSCMGGRDKVVAPSSPSQVGDRARRSIQSSTFPSAFAGEAFEVSLTCHETRSELRPPCLLVGVSAIIVFCLTEARLLLSCVGAAGGNV